MGCWVQSEGLSSSNPMPSIIPLGAGIHHPLQEDALKEWGAGLKHDPVFGCWEELVASGVRFL